MSRGSLDLGQRTFSIKHRKVDRILRWPPTFSDTCTHTFLPPHPAPNIQSNTYLDTAAKEFCRCNKGLKSADLKLKRLPYILLTDLII